MSPLRCLGEGTCPSGWGKERGQGDISPGRKGSYQISKVLSGFPKNEAVSPCAWIKPLLHSFYPAIFCYICYKKQLHSFSLTKMSQGVIVTLCLFQDTISSFMLTFHKLGSLLLGKS